MGNTANESGPAPRMKGAGSPRYWRLLEPLSPPSSSFVSPHLLRGFPLQSIFSFSLRDVTCWQSLRRVPCARSIDSRRLILCVVGGAGNIALEGSHIAAPQAVELGDYRGVLQPRASVKNSKAPAGTIPQLFLFKKQQMWAVEAIVWTRMWKLKFYIYVRTIA